MECSVCGAGDELLYACGRCGEQLCATHQGRSYHVCEPPRDSDWTPPGARDTTEGRWVSLPRRDATSGTGAEAVEGADERPTTGEGDAGDGEEDGTAAATSTADTASIAGVASTATGSTAADADLPPDAARPGYGPDSLRPDPVEPADTLSEWLRRQTYVSLSLKVGFVATLWSAFVFSTLAVGLSVVGA